MASLRCNKVVNRLPPMSDALLVCSMFVMERVVFLAGGCCPFFPGDGDLGGTMLRSADLTRVMIVSLAAHTQSFLRSHCVDEIAMCLCTFWIIELLDKCEAESVTYGQ